MGSKWSFNN